MQQLVELQQHYVAVQAAGGEIIAVFREQGPAATGLENCQKNSGAQFLLWNDPQAAATPDYAVGESVFNTYLIDQQGTIRAILSGTTYDRPSGDQIFNTFTQMTE